MSCSNQLGRRDFLGQSLAVAGAAGMTGIAQEAAGASAPPATPVPPHRDRAASMPCGTLGSAKISRLLLGGNLIGGHMHSRDLKYVNSLFRAYATEEKILETLALAEAYGINTVFETGGDFVRRYNKDRGGRMQFIPLHRDPDELEPGRAV